jgi:hypothetical protein
MVFLYFFSNVVGVGVGAVRVVVLELFPAHHATFPAQDQLTIRCLMPDRTVYLFLAYDVLPAAGAGEFVHVLMP